MIVPAYPAFNVYSGVARNMTALGPVCVATAVNDVPGWDVKVIDENNYRRKAPRGSDGLPDHGVLQRIRPADAVGLYGGLTSTIPRLLRVASFYQGLGVPTIAGGQHFVDESVDEALRGGVDYVVGGEGEEVIKELLEVLDGTRRKETSAVSPTWTGTAGSDSQRATTWRTWTGCPCPTSPCSATLRSAYTRSAVSGAAA